MAGGELPELTRHRAAQLLCAFCEARVPLGVRHSVRLSYSIQGATATLFEERAPWSGARNPAWTRSPVAQFRYNDHRRRWTLYWRDRNRRWHRFTSASPAQDIGDLIDALDADPTGIF